jgi:release factor glutamine methyltransferase
MASVAERLAQARAQLEAAGLSPADAALDAEVLARHVMQWDRAQLIVRARDTEPSAFADRLAALIARRAAREPVAQIVGHREFWGLEFEVTSDVLVPRPETEIIVEEAIDFGKTAPCRTVVDVGTGSGCLAVAIAHEMADTQVAAIDVSPDALVVAQRNASRHGVADRIRFLHGNVLEPLADGSKPWPTWDVRVDLIVSNPPYVRDGDAPGLSAEVRDHEPHAALFGGKDGFDVIRQLLDQAHAHLAAAGRLVVEFGFGHGDQMIRLAGNAGWTILRVRDDLQGIPRTIVLTRK